jgi:hypothetical protein
MNPESFEGVLRRSLDAGGAGTGSARTLTSPIGIANVFTEA